MLIDAKQSALLVVDVQGRLVPAISGWQALLDQVVWLIRVARRMEIPVLACEQYPQGLGPTHPLVAAELPEACIAGKLHFSAVAGGCHGFSAAGKHPQLVVCGMETHVCVLQTVMELLASGRQVFVVEEAVGSRHDSDKALALARMRQAGASIVSREMVAFEWLRKADSDLFREISRNFLR
ncbi:isochorismatase family protein [Sulfuritalea sp.]|uniref:isochorismatase family protein n=1 Tax=Sulfuritalea sp. TaxID=2480090 RepID=UPI001AC5825C|nr:isochorismatase family protein [Sulfuritalea sp.]MBN8474254.1 isochorismatase family protein [Sulfuritalea sp.]